MIILPNGVAVIEGDSHHSVWCSTEGLVHDKFTSSIIAGIMKEYRVKAAFDCGANIGTLTRCMLDAGASVLAFEPNPAALACLEFNCPQATIIPAGVGDVFEMAGLQLQPNAGASYLSKGKDVAITTLDRFQRWLGDRPLGFIKLDVEGYEEKALKGGLTIIRKHKPVILCEINEAALIRCGSSPKNVFDLIEVEGYRWHIIQPDCKAGDPQFDILAIPS